MPHATPPTSQPAPRLKLQSLFVLPSPLDKPAPATQPYYPIFPATPLKSWCRLQSFFFLLLSVSLFILLTTIATLSSIISPWLCGSKKIRQHHSRTVLITNVYKPEALALARMFHNAGHKVVAADYEPYYIPLPAHFSKSIDVFYRLGKQQSHLEKKLYFVDLLSLVRKEKIDLWIDCRGGELDFDATEILEQETSCRAVQFDKDVIAKLEEIGLEAESVRSIGLDITGTTRITSESEAIALLYPEKKKTGPQKSYNLKKIANANKFDSATITCSLPLFSRQQTEEYILTLDLSPTNPLVFQESSAILNYTTHSLILDGVPAAFVAYPTSDSQFTSLPASSLLSATLLCYTTLLISKVASACPKNQVTGHLSLTFGIPEDLALKAEAECGGPHTEVDDLLKKIWVVDTTPAPAIGILAFADVSDDLVSAYLSLLPDHDHYEAEDTSNSHRNACVLTPKSGTLGYYFFGTELVNSGSLPVFGFLKREVGLKGVIDGWAELLGRVLRWREAWFEVSDPWVAWWAYGGYAFGTALAGLWEGKGLESKDE